MLCAVTGAWAEDATIDTSGPFVLTTNDDHDLTNPPSIAEWLFNQGKTDFVVNGTITQTGLNI